MGNATKPGFIRSEKLAKLISELSTEEMKKLNILLEQVCPPGQEIIPWWTDIENNLFYRIELNTKHLKQYSILLYSEYKILYQLDNTIKQL